MEHYVALPNHLQICFFTVFLMCHNLVDFYMVPSVELWIPVIFYQINVHSAVDSVGSVVLYPFFLWVFEKIWILHGEIRLLLSWKNVQILSLVCQQIYLQEETISLLFCFDLPQSFNLSSMVFCNFVRQYLPKLVWKNGFAFSKTSLNVSRTVFLSPLFLNSDISKGDDLCWTITLSDYFLYLVSIRIGATSIPGVYELGMFCLSSPCVLLLDPFGTEDWLCVLRDWPFTVLSILYSK